MLPSVAQVVPYKAARLALSGAKKTVPTGLENALRREIFRKQPLAALGVRGGAYSLSVAQAAKLSADMLAQTKDFDIRKLHNDWLGLAVNFEDVSRLHAEK